MDCGVDTYAIQTFPGLIRFWSRFVAFSHRRATHAGAADCGRQIAVIALPGPADGTGQSR